VSDLEMEDCLLEDQSRHYTELVPASETGFNVQRLGIIAPSKDGAEATGNFSCGRSKVPICD